MPDSYAESTDGVLLIANGIDPVIRWDGFGDLAEPAGVLGPRTAPSLSFGAGSSGPITGSYRCYVRYVDRYGLVSNLSPVSVNANALGATTVTYFNLPTPTEARVERRQILRNTAGQMSVFYVDIDTEDLTSHTLESSRTDAELAAQQSQSVVAVGGLDPANRFHRPPDHKPFVCSHSARMYMAGTPTYAEGSVSVTKGDVAVRGRGTRWPANFGGRFLYVAGADRPYEIAGVDVNTQTVVLFDAYQGDTDPYAGYAIRPEPAQTNLLYYSEAGLPEAFPPTNALAVPEDGDTITGLFDMSGFLYVTKRRHVYRMTAQNNPGKDGYIYLAVTRGAVNHRCVVVVDEFALILDERGVYAFTGAQTAEPVSTPIQDVFRNDSPLSINWRASRYFHAVNSPLEETVRFFVALRGDYLPRHALAFNHKLRRWWLEEYAHPIGSSAIGWSGQTVATWREGGERVYLGGPAGRVFALGESALDGYPDGGGHRYAVSAASPTSVTVAGFDLPDLAGVPVAVVSGRGAGQTRMVAGVSGGTARLESPWLVLPDSTSAVQFGGIPYRFVTHLMRFVGNEAEGERGAEIQFIPQPRGEKLRLSWRYDFAEAVKAGGRIEGAHNFGVAAARGEAGQEVSLDKREGFAIVPFDGHREGDTDGPRTVGVTLEGVSGASPHRVTTLIVKGVT